MSRSWLLGTEGARALALVADTNSGVDAMDGHRHPASIAGDLRAAMTPLARRDHLGGSRRPTRGVERQRCAARERATPSTLVAGAYAGSFVDRRSADTDDLAPPTPRRRFPRDDAERPR